MKRCWDYLKRTHKDLYVQIECVPQSSKFRTEPVFNAGRDFKFDESHKNEKKFNLGEFEPSDLRFRVTIQEEEGMTHQDRLVGFGQVDLKDDLADGHLWYITVPVGLGGDPTGEVHLELIRMPGPSTRMHRCAKQHARGRVYCI